jgi:hypothetical protein
MKLWIVGMFRERVYTREVEGVVWEFGGVFSKKQDAINACTNENMFIGESVLDYRVPDDPVEWPNVWYPMLEKEREK